MTDKPPSDRRLLAERIAAFINDNRLNSPFGGEVDQSGDKRSYDILFSIPRLLDGLVRVYGLKFILIQTQGPLARGTGERVFTSEQNALAGAAFPPMPR